MLLQSVHVVLNYSVTLCYYSVTFMLLQCHVMLLQCHGMFVAVLGKNHRKTKKIAGTLEMVKRYVIK